MLGLFISQKTINVEMVAPGGVAFFTLLGRQIIKTRNPFRQPHGLTFFTQLQKTKQSSFRFLLKACNIIK